jgi:hypothetical protein
MEWLARRRERMTAAEKDQHSHHPSINPVSDAIAMALLYANQNRERKLRPDEITPHYSFKVIL